MNFFKYFALLAVAALMIPATAAARDKNERTVNIADMVEVGNVQLKPGTYKVTWQQQGSNVQVTFLQGRKTIATAPATLKTNSQITNDDIVIDHTSNQPMLREIDFTHGKESLIFDQGA